MMRTYMRVAQTLCALMLLSVGGPPARGQAAATSGSATSGSATSGSATSGSATSGSATLGSATPKPGRLHLLVDFPYQLWNEGGTRIHVVAFTPNFKPASGAEVWLAGKRVGHTDRDGTLIFHFKSPRGWKGADLVVRRRHRGRLWVGRQEIGAYRRTSSYEKNRVYLYTDRGIYRPGERLRARVVAFRMRDSYEPLAGRQAVLSLSSPWGEVQRQALTLDSFGVAHAMVDLAELEPVRHTLSVQVGGARHSRTVKLAHFKRPAVELRHTLPRWFTVNSKELQGTIRILDLDGKSPRGGSLEVTVEAGGEKLASKTFPIDGRGERLISFPRPDVARFAKTLTVGQVLQVRLSARLADGTSAESEHHVRLEAQPYRAVVELDRDDYPPGGIVRALVKLSDPDDLPARGVPVTLALPGGQRLTATSNPQGTASFTFRAPHTKASAGHAIGAFVPEVKGPIARTALEVKQPRPMESRLGVSQVISRHTVPIAVTLRPGFTPLERVLHVDVTDHSGAIVAGFTLPWRRMGARWEARGQLRAPSWGTMLLTMFSLAARTGDLRDPGGRPRPVTPETAGVIMDGQQVTVHPDEALRLTISGVPDELKPGAQVTLGLRILGPDGKPRDALVGGALVDANVLALGDPLADIDPLLYFYNPQLRVMASTGSKMLTWPVLARTWSCHRYDIALPPFGFAEGGPDDCGEGGFGLAGHGYGGGGAYGHGGSPERFTMRERFEATSWWAPALRAPGGQLRTTLTMPDSISRQTLLVVASDRRGGIGVLRRTITVRSPLSLELDLPDSLVTGEDLEVVGLARNGTQRPLDLTLIAKGEGIALLAVPARLRVPVGSPTPFRIRIRATKPGPASLELRAWQGTRGDALKRDLTVRPAGEPHRETLSATARAGAPARLSIRRQRGDVALAASLVVDYPHLVPALQSAEAALAHPSLGGDTSASVLQTAALVLTSQRSLPTRERHRLRALLARGAGWLLAAQAPDGSFAYWRHGLPDPVHTAYVLETLLDVRGAGVGVPEAPLARAAAYLLGALAPDGLWDVSTLAFWEGSGPDIRSGLSATIFKALAMAVKANVIGTPASKSGTAPTRAKAAAPAQTRAAAPARAKAAAPARAKAAAPARAKAAAPEARHPPKAATGRAAQQCALPLDPRLAALAARMERYVSGSSRDPRTVAAALEGLRLLYTRCDRDVPSVRKVTSQGRVLTTAGIRKRTQLTHTQRAVLEGGTRHLLALRDRQHWEPTWFDAYGGQLEATATAMRILARLDPKRHAQVIREAAAFLIARRQAWGEWHNERGTAAAIRALMEVAGTGAKERDGAMIRILVDGKTIRELRLDPADPWANAAMLGQLRLTDHVGPKGCTVEVRYNGSFALPVRVALRRWPGPVGPSPQAKTGISAPSASTPPTTQPATAASASTPPTTQPATATSASTPPTTQPVTATSTSTPPTTQPATAASTSTSPATQLAPSAQMQAQARTRIRIPRTMRLHERLRITIPLSSIPLPKIHSHRQGLASDARGLASGARGLVLQMPFHLAPDPEGLKALRRAHPWLGLTLRGGTWTLTLPPRPPVAELHLPLVATRRGSSWVTWRPLVTWPPLPMAPIAHGSLPVTVH